jgi:flagellar motility protein MotE (MotC chaperone)
MAEKERKHQLQEIGVLNEKISVLEARIKEYAEEVEAREDTDKLVQGHVQELIL